MELTFEDAVAPETNRGRKAEDNPFEAVVQAIAMKTTDEGKPVAKSVRLSVPKAEKDEVQGDVTVKFINSVIGKLKNAGDKAEPRVTVYRQITTYTDPKKGDTIDVVFWTGQKIERKAKPKNETVSEPA